LKIKKTDISSIFPIIINKIKLILEDVNRPEKFKFCILYISEFTVLVRVNIDNLNDFSKDLSKVVLEFEPGEKYYYGVNQALLGRVVEVVSKKNFYAFLKEEIFEPFDIFF